MNYLDHLGQSLGWMLFHSTWQLALIAIGVKVVLMLVPEKKTNLRYLFLLFSLVVAVAWSSFTFYGEWRFIHEYPGELEVISSSADKIVISSKYPNRFKMEDLGLGETTHSFSLKKTLVQMGNQLNPYMPLIALCWYIGTLIFSSFIFIGFFRLRTISRKGIYQPSEEWIERFELLKKQMNVSRPVRFMMSNIVKEPITFYSFKPIVLVPIAIFSGLTKDQVEVLLLHELAHIRRYDFSVNLLQTIIEVLFFFHPAVWWISNKIRDEREHCCDDLVIGIRNNPIVYAEALTQIQIYQNANRSNLILAASGNTGGFSKRIFRLFGRYDQKSSLMKGAFTALFLLFFIATQAFYLPGKDTLLSEEIATRLSKFLETKSNAGINGTNVLDEKELDLTELMKSNTSSPAPHHKKQSEVIPVSGGLPTGVWSSLEHRPRSNTHLSLYLMEKPATVKIEITTLSGNLVETLTDQNLKKGTHEFKWKHGTQKGTFALNIHVDCETMVHHIEVL